MYAHLHTHTCTYKDPQKNETPRRFPEAPLVSRTLQSEFCALPWILALAVPSHDRLKFPILNTCWQELTSELVP